MTEDECTAKVGQARRAPAFGVTSPPAPPELTEPARGAPRTQRRSGRSPNFITLWIIVSGLWIVATWLRIQRVWVPGLGWPALLDSPFTWISLLIPPLVFAIVLVAMSQIAARSGH